jgi:hypothetical protein
MCLQRQQNHAGTQGDALMKPFKIILIVSFTLAVIGYGNLTEGAFGKQTAYLYGKFSMTSDYPAADDICLVFINLKTKERYNFKYDTNEQTSYRVMTVPPGKYQVEAVAYFKSQIVIRYLEELRLFSGIPYRTTIKAKKRQAIYVGDFEATCHGLAETMYEFDIKPPVDNYQETTDKIKENYSFVNGMKTKSAFN